MMVYRFAPQKLACSKEGNTIMENDKVNWLPEERC